MKNSYQGDCFQCGGSNTRIRSFIGEFEEEEAYFCDIKCMQKFSEKEEDVETKSPKEELESVRRSLITIVNRWADNKMNEGYFAYICGLLSEGEQPLVITKAQTAYMISKCQNIEKLRSALAYVDKEDCVIF